mmetsp:Transcript_22613/g.52011  ORF Transcript_22613/g.52011 Transcript_22613/m.52011 type:complete len:363 (+) Transcript_22613:397-1485(+)
MPMSQPWQLDMPRASIYSIPTNEYVRGTACAAIFREDPTQWNCPINIKTALVTRSRQEPVFPWIPAWTWFVLLPKQRVKVSCKFPTVKSVYMFVVWCTVSMVVFNYFGFLQLPAGYDFVQAHDVRANHNIDCRLCPEELVPEDPEPTQNNATEPTAPSPFAPSPTAPSMPSPVVPTTPAAAPATPAMPAPAAPTVPTTPFSPVAATEAPSSAPTSSPTPVPKDDISGLSPFGLIAIVLVITALSLTLIPGSVYLGCIWRQRYLIQQQSKESVLDKAEEGIQTAPTADEDDEDNDEEHGSRNQGNSSHSPPSSVAAAQTIVQNSTSGSTGSDEGESNLMEARAHREEEEEEREEPAQDERVLV